jgi:hypothetical protein
LVHHYSLPVAVIVVVAAIDGLALQPRQPVPWRRFGWSALCWAALRGRDQQAYDALPQQGHGRVGGSAYGAAAGHPTADASLALARSRDGHVDSPVNVHELADDSSLVRRRFRNGDTISLTGRRAEEWLEVDGGGWVREADVRFERAGIAAGQRTV